MKTKLKQTISAVTLIILITFGLIYALQKFANVDKPQISTPDHKIPNSFLSPAESTGTTLFQSDLVEDLSKLSPEKRCEQINDNDAQLNCYDNLVLKEVLASNMLLACDDLRFYLNIQYCQDFFYKNKALIDADINLCNKVQDEYLKRQCEDSINLRISVRDSSLESCEQITNLEQKNNCIDKVTLKSAITNANVAQCDLLKDDYLKELCQNKSSKKLEEQNYIQALETQNITLCSNLSEEKSLECQDAVNYNRGISSNNISVCAQIVDRKTQLDCINKVSLNLAKTEENPEYCFNIQDNLTQTSCLRNINSLLLKSAITTNNSDKCKLITDDSLMQKCLSAM